MPVDPPRLIAPSRPGEQGPDPSGPPRPGFDRAALLAALRARLGRAGGRGEPPVIPLCPEMDRALLGGGLARAALHEILSEDDGPEDDGAAAGFAALLAARSGGTVLWIARDGHPAPPRPARFGLSASRLILARPGRRADALWAAEEALGCRAVSAVLLAERPDEDGMRRLRLAAGTGGGIGLLLGGAEAGEGPSPAATRWRVTGGASGARDLGDPQWTLALLGPGRAGRARDWRVTWRAGIDSLVVEEAPGEEAPGEEAPRRARRA